eukprot:CAMPEP_0181492762 /NCGR_PEP_ID=MMETSP1110-20121109/50862_1 /TAXON_ID=174948 /ORGANISM="Symbiodinium sp., Strain CCMP421" /LENGTH=197 /DNA_ID=CAMNT_0023620031 /DNA_START=1 /DNA_END=591 /DNA_ORIENTATION=-
MKDPVTPEAKESFGKMSNVKDLKNTAMGGVMGLHKNRPDEGFMRAAMAASESHRIGGSHPPGYLPMTPVQASSYSRSDKEPCTTKLLEMRYDTLKRLMNEAQFIASQDPYRFMELVRAEELSSFLNRSDNSVVSREEVSQLGEALAATLNAGRGARTDYTAPLRHSEEKVPIDVSDAIGMVQQAMRDVVTYAWRCRA